MPPPSTLRGNRPSSLGVIYRGPELAHPVYQVGDRSLAHPGDPVHSVRSLAQGQRGRQEAGHRSGVADEEVEVARGDHPPQAPNADHFLVDVEVEAEFDEGAHQPVGII